METDPLALANKATPWTSTPLLSVVAKRDWPRATSSAGPASSIKSLNGEPRWVALGRIAGMRS